MNCAGCGKKISDHYIPAVEISQEFCGECNQKYYEFTAQQEEIDRLERQARAQERWNRLVARYGESMAAEILGDQG